MTNNYSLYKNATYTMAGAACLVQVMSMLFWSLGNGDKSLVPGFSYMAGLATPILATWLGLVIRRRLSPDKWIVILLIAFLWMMISYCRYPAVFVFHNEIMKCLACMIIGYTMSPDYAESCSQRRDSSRMLFLLVVAVLAYTCVSIVKQRIFVCDFPAEYEDLSSLILHLLQIADGMTVILSMHIIIRFSFSPWGIWLGGIKWGQWFMWVVFALSFINTIRYFVAVPKLYSLFRILANPFTLYLAIVVFRVNGKWFGKSDLSWRKVFSLEPIKDKDR